ncbi:MAG: hypothetical protein KAR40_16020 [Candidatus Sabulitectum sp.]|nr:hypothetical protein [Candidatus Sabulitectum sp.]
MIHENNPVVALIEAVEDKKFNTNMNKCKWLTALVVSPFMLCVGIMIGVYLENLIG